MEAQKFTVEQAQKWAEENAKELDANHSAAAKKEPAVEFARAMTGNEVWNAGAWLGTTLRDLKCNEPDITKAMFAAGQRMYYKNPWVVAVEAANRYVATGQLDEPGESLAKRLHDDQSQLN